MTILYLKSYNWKVHFIFYSFILHAFAYIEIKSSLETRVAMSASV